MRSEVYVPPHLRRVQQARDAERKQRELDTRRNPPRYEENYHPEGDGYGNYGPAPSRDADYNRQGRYEGRSENGVYSTRNFFKPSPSTPGGRPSRWDSLEPGTHSYRGYPSRRSSSVNEKGFHGKMYPSHLTEKELFDTSDHVTEGINFDKVASAVPAHE